MQEQDRESSSGTIRRVFWFAVLVSSVAVASFFIYTNLTLGRGGAPLGYDTYLYQNRIREAAAQGPLQFAASRHYVEFLYPIIASIPVYLGATPETAELFLPPILAIFTVLATGHLASMSRDIRVAILSVALASGWFALYRMGVDFHSNLLALPILLLASAYLLKARLRKVSGTFIGIFLFLVVSAAAAHVQTTEFFIAVWFASFLLLGGNSRLGAWKSSVLMISAAILVTSPLAFAYFTPILGGLVGQYCVFPGYWLWVFGPTVGLTIIGVGVVAKMTEGKDQGGDFFRFLIVWSTIALVIGVLGYTVAFPISVSDRTLLLFPVPFVSAVGLLWLLNRVPGRPTLSRRLLASLALIIPLLAVPAVFAYAAPTYFHYYASHDPALETCPSNAAPKQAAGVVQTSLISTSAVDNPISEPRQYLEILRIG